METLMKVGNLYELYNLASTDSTYLKLLKFSSSNLGGPSMDASFAEHKRWLERNAMETSEEAVIDEINSVRDLVGIDPFWERRRLERNAMETSDGIDPYWEDRLGDKLFEL